MADPDRPLQLPSWLSRRSIAAAGSALALVTLTLGAAFVAYERSEIDEQERDRVALHARLLEDHANRTFNTLDLTLTAIDDTLHSTTRAPSGQSALLERSVAMLPFLRSLSVLDAQGQVLASSARDNLGRRVDLARVPLPQERFVERFGGLVTGRDLVDAAAGAVLPTGGHRRSFIPLVRRLSGESTSTLYLVAVLNPDFFPNEHSLMLGAPQLGAALASLDGVLLTTTEGIRQRPGASLRGRRLFTDFLPRRERGSYLGPGIDGTAMATAFRVLRRQPLVVIVESDHAVVQAAVWRLVGWTGAVCLVSLVVIAMGAGLAMRNLRSHNAVHLALLATRKDIAAGEQRMRSLVESVRELIFRTDPQGVVSFVNVRWEQITGRPGDSTIGLRFAQLCLPADRARVDALFAMPAQASAEPVTAQVHASDGALRTLEVSVAPVLGADGGIEGYAGFALDVSERRRARDELQAQLDFTAQLIEISPTPLFVKDIQGRFLRANRAWLELMGLRPDQVLGFDSNDLYGADAPKHIEHDRRLLESCDPIRYENRLVRPDLEERDTVVSKVHFTGADGRPAGIVGSIIDVTEFREAERATAQARDAAERANRSKSDFIATITHELRTPLQAIIGFSEIGSDSSRQAPELHEMFDDIHAGGRRMLTLVNGLLDLAKMESSASALTLRPADLGELSAQVVRELRPLTDPRGLRFELLASARPLPTVVDGPRIQQVMRNIIANALRFAPDASCIEIDGSDLGEDGIEWTVRDHGPGIPESERRSIFEAFVQSSRTRTGAGGTGLGLTICDRIVRAHGGRVEAYNAPGGGAVFRVWLPARRAASARLRTTVSGPLTEVDILLATDSA